MSKLLTATVLAAVLGSAQEDLDKLSQKLGSAWTEIGGDTYKGLTVSKWQNDSLNREEVWWASEAEESFLLVRDDVFVLAQAGDDGDWFTLPKTVIIFRAGAWHRVEREGEKVPFRDLVGHWKLAETEGTEARDACGYGSHGKHVKGPKVDADSRSLAFDGKGAHVNVGAAPILSLSDGFTLAAWVRPSGAGGEAGGIIASKEGEYELGRSPDGKIQFAMANETPGWNWTETEAALPVDKWTHVAWSYSAKEKITRVYANGKEVFKTAAEGKIGDEYPDQNEFWIGGRQKEGGAEFFEGRIADVRLYDSALKAEEVAAIHSATAR